MSYPLAALLKPTSSRCNLTCSYCLYPAKQEMYPWSNHPAPTLETFEVFLRQYMRLSAPYFSLFSQGGEPTMMGLPFFEAAAALAARIAREVVPDRTPLVRDSTPCRRRRSIQGRLETAFLAKGTVGEAS